MNKNEEIYLKGFHSFVHVDFLNWFEDQLREPEIKDKEEFINYLLYFFKQSKIKINHNRISSSIKPGILKKTVDYSFPDDIYEYLEIEKKKYNQNNKGLENMKKKSSGKLTHKEMFDDVLIRSFSIPYLIEQINPIESDKMKCEYLKFIQSQMDNLLMKDVYIGLEDYNATTNLLNEDQNQSLIKYFSTIDIKKVSSYTLEYQSNINVKGTDIVSRFEHAVDSLLDKYSPKPIEFTKWKEVKEYLRTIQDDNEKIKYLIELKANYLQNKDGIDIYNINETPFEEQIELEIGKIKTLTTMKNENNYNKITQDNEFSKINDKLKEVIVKKINLNTPKSRMDMSALASIFEPQYSDVQILELNKVYDSEIARLQSEISVYHTTLDKNHSIQLKSELSYNLTWNLKTKDNPDGYSINDFLELAKALVVSKAIKGNQEDIVKGLSEILNIKIGSNIRTKISNVKKSRNNDMYCSSVKRTNYKKNKCNSNISYYEFS